MSMEYSIVIGGNVGSQLEFLRAELQRLKFEEETHLKGYHVKRGELQDTWSKLVNIRIHLKRFQDEAEEVRVEIAAVEAEKSYWNGELDDIQDGIAHMSVASASRAAEAQSLREKLFLKDSLLTNLVSLDEEIAETRKKQLLFSQALKDMNTRSVSMNLVDASTDSVTSSMEVRQQLIATSKHLDGLEDKMLVAKAQLAQVQRELERALGKSLTPQKGKPVERPVEDSESTDHESSTATPKKEDMLDIVSHGSAFSKDLAAALLSPQPIMPASAGIAVKPENAHLYTVDEVIAGETRLYRVNGEAPRDYLARLDRRIQCLAVLEAQLVTQFNQTLQAIRRVREISRDLEIKRLKVEMQVMRLEKVRQEAMNSAIRLKDHVVAQAAEASVASSSLQPRQEERNGHSISHDTIQQQQQAFARSVEERPRNASTPSLPPLPPPASASNPTAYLPATGPRMKREELEDVLGNLFTSPMQSAPPSRTTPPVHPHPQPLLQSQQSSQTTSPSRPAASHVRSPAAGDDEMGEEEDAQRRQLMDSLRSLASYLQSPGMPHPSLRSSAEVLREEKEILQLIGLYLSQQTQPTVQSLQQQSLKLSVLAHLLGSAETLAHSPAPGVVESGESAPQAPASVHASPLREEPIPRQSTYQEQIAPQEAVSPLIHASGPPKVAPNTAFRAIGGAIQTTPERNRTDPAAESGDSGQKALVSTRARSPTRRPRSWTPMADSEEAQTAVLGSRRHRTCVVCSRQPRLPRQSIFADPTAMPRTAPSPPLSNSPLCNCADTSPSTDPPRAPQMPSLADRLQALSHDIERSAHNNLSATRTSPAQVSILPAASSSPGTQAAGQGVNDAQTVHALQAVVQNQAQEIARLLDFKAQVEALLLRPPAQTSSTRTTMDTSLSDMATDTSIDRPTTSAAVTPVAPTTAGGVKDLVTMSGDFSLEDDGLGGGGSVEDMLASLSAPGWVMQGDSRGTAAAQLLALLRTRGQQAAERVQRLSAQAMAKGEESMLWLDSLASQDHFNLEVEVQAAKHLPVMKSITRSTSAYVEAALVRWEGPYDQLLAHCMDLEYDRSRGVASVLMQRLSETEDEPVAPLFGYQHTSVQEHNLYPEWRESLRFPRLHLTNSGPLVLWLLVKEAGGSTGGLGRGDSRNRDEIIAQGVWPLTEDRLDSAWHKYDIPLVLPHPQRMRKGRQPLDSQCNLRIAVKHHQSSLRRWMRLCEEATSLLAVLGPLLEAGNEGGGVTLDASLRQRVRAFLRITRALLEPPRPRRESVETASTAASRSSTPSRASGRERRGSDPRLVGLRDREKVAYVLRDYDRAASVRDSGSMGSRKRIKVNTETPAPFEEYMRGRRTSPRGSLPSTPTQAAQTTTPATFGSAGSRPSTPSRGTSTSISPRARSYGGPGQHFFPIHLGTQQRAQEVWQQQQQQQQLQERAQRAQSPVSSVTSQGSGRRR